jgi:hypothetical protein
VSHHPNPLPATRAELVGLDQPTQAYLRQLAQVVDQPAPPDLMARRRRALHAMVEFMLPDSRPILGVKRPATEAEYMALVRAMAARAGMSFNAIAKATEDTEGVDGVPKSTVHDVLSRDRLPRREGQLRALLAVLITANHGNDGDLEALLELRARLLSARIDRTGPGGDGEPAGRPGANGVRTPSMGFQVDIVDFGRRREHAQEDLERRLRTLVRDVLGRTGLDCAGLTYLGDGARVVLSPHTDPTDALAAVLTTTSSALTDDNHRFRDRMRLRMALDFGLARRTEHGLVGNLLIDLRRLIDSPVIRDAVTGHPRWDLVALVSNRLHDLVKPEQLVFECVKVESKEYFSSGWLWLPGDVE